MATLNNRTPRNMTYRQFVYIFDRITTNHFQLQSFSRGTMDEVDINKMNLEDFPFLYLSPQPASVDAQTITYSFEIIIADQTQLANLEDSNKPSVGITPRGDAHSYTLNIMRDVIANFRQSIQTGSYVDAGVELELPMSITPFEARFDNILTGWSTIFNVTCQNTNNLCDVPQFMNTGA